MDLLHGPSGLVTRHGPSGLVTRHGPSGLVTRHGLSVLVSLVFALAACGAGAPAGPNAADATKVAPTPASPVLPWRYGPALANGVPPGVTAEPVLEVADGLRGRARIVVAVAEGEAPVRLEVWEFSQNNPRERLERVDAPVVLLDLDPAAVGRPPAALEQLRRDMASPASESVRPVGLAVAEPAELLAELARAAAAAVNGPGRAAALARVTRGLDDQLLWSPAFPGLLLRLAGPPWQVEEATPVGERRTLVVAREGERRLEIMLTRTQDRWVLVSVVDALPDKLIAE